MIFNKTGYAAGIPLTVSTSFYIIFDNSNGDFIQ